ncbi:uncharacterized protein LOC118422732 [Branchiostoma floridae]|uniref:Uncharacterized protein LOC118422732 n=1 Tax=Branchiostoma floridae TaxID=7739 RepID=A0A9J7LPG4_BRAFL|nr:uncharacterized protein LOC118422732 [Branchiostoma floridae]
MTTITRVRLVTIWHVLKGLYSPSKLKNLDNQNLRQVVPSTPNTEKVDLVQEAVEYFKRIGWLRMALLFGSSCLIAAAPTHEWWRVTGDDVDKIIGRAELSFGGEMFGRAYRSMALRRALQVVECMNGDERVQALSKIFTRLVDLQTDLYEAESVCREGVQLMEETGPTKKKRYLLEGMRTRLAVAWMNQDRARERMDLSPGTSHTHQAVRLLRNAARVLETYAKENLDHGTPSRKPLLQLANTYQCIGCEYKNSEAERSLQTSLFIYQHIYGLAHDRTIDVLKDLGNLYKYQGEYDKAVSYYRRAVELGKVCAPWAVSAILRNLGTTFVDMKDKKEARATFEMALQAAQYWQSVQLFVGENNDWEENEAEAEEGQCRYLLDWVEEQ